MTDDPQARDPQARLTQLLRAQAALDGELDAANALAFERDLATDEALKRAQNSGAAVRAALRAHAPKERAPDALRARVLALAEPKREPRRFNVRSPWYGALAASLVAVAFLSGYFVGGRPGAAPEEVALGPLVDSFTRAQISGQPFDVASSDRHTVKPWLASRLTLGAEVLDLADAGFPLAGGRVDVINETPVATLVYRHREHWIDVTELPLRPGSAADASAPLTVNGFHVREWRDGARKYIAVSDIDVGELDALVEAFRHKASASGAASENTP